MATSNKGTVVGAAEILVTKTRTTTTAAMIPKSIIFWTIDHFVHSPFAESINFFNFSFIYASHRRGIPPLQRTNQKQFPITITKSLWPDNILTNHSTSRHTTV